MRFQNTSLVQFPSAMSVEARSVLAMDSISVSQTDPRSGIKRASVISPSGATAIVIPGSRRLRILLTQLLVSWANLTAVGHLEIRSHGKPAILMFQSGKDGQIVIPCHDEQLFLGNYGLRSLNNSVGGEYAITANYEIMET